MRSTAGSSTACRRSDSSSPASRCGRCRSSPHGSCFRSRSGARRSVALNGSPARTATDPTMKFLTRRAFSPLVASSLLARRAFAQSDTSPILKRAIPKTGERIPAVGLGTASTFDRDSEPARRSASEVIHALLDGGGRLIDTASTYGDAEVVLGKVIAAEHLREQVFIATKLEEPDEAELQRSLSRLRTAKL